MKFERFPLLAVILCLWMIAPQRASLCTPRELYLSIGDEYYTVSRTDKTRFPWESFNDNQAYLVFTTQNLCEFIVQVTEESSEKTVFEAPVDYIENPAIEETEEETEDLPSENTIVHTTFLKNLSFDKMYRIKIIDNQGDAVGSPLSFRLPSPYLSNSNSNSNKILFLGGWLTDKQRNLLSSQLFSSNENFSGVVQVGDVKCDSESNCDKLFENLQTISANAPIILTSVDSNPIFEQRIKNPLFEMTQNHFYSFNLGGIHFVYFSLEYFETSTPEKQHNMFLWIDNDLRKANTQEQRNTWSWIVVVTDKTFENARFKQIEDLLLTHRVNLVITSQEGGYERINPTENNSTKIERSDKNIEKIYDSTTPVYILEGSGFETPQTAPEIIPEELSKNSTEEKSGYGILYARNNSNFSTLIYERYDLVKGEKIDELNLINLHASTQIQTQSEVREVPAQTESVQEKNPKQPVDEGELIFPPTEDLPIKEKEENSFPIALVLVGLFLVVILTGGALFYWKKRKVISPEHERLKMSAFKSIRVYGPNTERNLAMVDLVL